MVAALAAALLAPVAVLLDASPAGAETTTVIDQFGSSANEFGQAVITDASGNVYVLGQTSGTLPGNTSAGGYDAFLQKYSSSGTVAWTAQFGSTSDDEGWGLAVDGSGNVYVAGSTDGVLPGCAPAPCSSAGGRDAYVRQYTPSGAVGWTRQFGTTGRDIAYGVAVSSGHVYVGGSTDRALPGFSNPGDYENGFVRQYDTDGTEGWTRQFGGTNTDASGTWYSNVYVNGVAVDSSGAVYLAGNADGNLDSCTPDPCSWDGAGYNGFVRQYTASGALGWTREFGGGSGSMDWVVVAVDGSGNVDVGGRTSGALPDFTNSGFNDAFVRQYSSTGTLLWTDQFGTAESDEVDMVAVDAAGNLYAAGRWGYGAGFARQYAADGTPGWSRQFTVVPWVGPNGVAVDGSANVFVVGVTSGAFPGFANAGDYDAFLTRFTTSAAGPTSTELTAWPEPSIAGGTVTYTATVTPVGGALDGGTVTFTEGESTLCAAVLVDTVTGQATCDVSEAAAGAHVVAVTYSGTAAFDLSWGYVTHTVNPATIATTTAVSADPTPSIVGGSVSYTATVGPTSGTLDGGTVAFTDGAAPISGCATEPVDSGTGVATCAVTYQDVGSHTITAAYTGTATYAGSTSTSITHDVTYGVDLTSKTTSRPGGRLRIKLTLTDASGTNISAAGVGLTVTGIDPSWGATPGGAFTFVGRRSAYYEYTLTVPSSAASGSYELEFTAGGDPVTHAVPVRVR